MAWTSGFFNSINNDRPYNAAQISGMFEGLITNGVFASVGNKLVVQPNSGMTIQINTGRGFFNGRWVKNDAPHLLILDPADVTLNRYCAVCVRVDQNNDVRTAEPYLKYSEFATNPLKPEMERSELVQEFCLAYVYIKANATAIAAADIEDTRANTEICGWVTGLIEQVDTSTLYKQWEDAYKTAYAAMLAYIDENETEFDALLARLESEIAGVEITSEMLLKSVYDTNNDGVVDDAEKLGGQPASNYVTTEQLENTEFVQAEYLRGEVETIPLNADCLGGYSADEYIKKSGGTMTGPLIFGDNIHQIFYFKSGYSVRWYTYDEKFGVYLFNGTDWMKTLFVFDNNGNIIENNLNGMDLLWTNASPKSNFVGQTITVNNILNYTGFLIVYAGDWGADSEGKASTGILPLGITYGRMEFCWSATNLFKRFVSHTPNTNKIIFTDALNNGNTQHTICIPLYIYGIK